MGYGCGDSFPLDFEPNGIPSGSENRKGKESGSEFSSSGIYRKSFNQAPHSEKTIFLFIFKFNGI